jgi:hypothetical protein
VVQAAEHGDRRDRAGELWPAGPVNEHPALVWQNAISTYKSNPDGTATVSFKDTYAAVCGAGVEFRLKSREMWGPANDPLPDGIDQASPVPFISDVKKTKGGGRPRRKHRKARSRLATAPPALRRLLRSFRSRRLISLSGIGGRYAVA